jgi:hypothetical protein
MSNYYDALPLEAAEQLEQLSRLAFELREDRMRLLAGQGVNSEEALLERIRQGDVPEHPAYEQYLGARALAAAREAVRSQLQGVLQELGGRP